MIDPVQIFESVSEAFEYRFIYGGARYINYELSNITDLPEGKTVIMMLPFTENGAIINSNIDTSTVNIPEENIGVRIENNIVLTSNGNFDLMQNIPITVEEIEDWMNG